MGDPAGAAAALVDLLADMRRVLGPEHPDTRATGDSIAYWQKRAVAHRAGQRPAV